MFKSVLLFLGLLLVPTLVFAADTSTIGIDLSFPNLEEAEPSQVSTVLQIFAVLTVLSLVPALLIALTAFTRIIIVLSMLRFAFGMQQTPPNTVLIALALFLTLFTMMPVVKQVESTALNPYLSGELPVSEAVTAAVKPLREFMIRQVREKDLAMVLDLQKSPQPSSFEEISNVTLVTAFMLSELQTAFQIGFVIFLPFLLVDLVVASVLMSMGMIMVPPLTLSLPIKILMFVLIDGWSLVAHSLVGSFI